ncbi:MAG TPA: tetratricopeptide repeat protein [Verrucomicrobiae bacterium]
MKYSFWPRPATRLLLALSTTVLLAAAAARAASPSDTLEQGIYSEETRGDIDAAMQLYQKVITQAKADQASAAQAQYHLGVCYYKKKDYNAATAAFDALIKDYPDQTNITALASKYLNGARALQPAPWSDGEVMSMDIKLEGGLKIGSAKYTVNAGETNGEKIWRFSTHIDAAGNQSVSSVEADAATFAPLHSRWKHTLLGEVDSVYFPGRVNLKKTGSDAVTKLDCQGSVIDNEETVEWMRCLPLADGFSTSAQLMASLGSHIIPVKFTVSGPEQVQVPAGSFDCYKIDLSIHQTFWVSADPKHYAVKFEAGGAVGELNNVTVQTPGQGAAYHDSAFGFSISAPAGWSFDKKDLDKKDRSAVAILDPQGVAASVLSVVAMSSIKDGETNSIRKAMENGLEEQAREFKNFQVRADGWQDLTLAGSPAVSSVSDYTAGTDTNVVYHVWSFAGANSVRFSVFMRAADFDSFRPKIDAVIATYKNQ